MPTDTAPDPTTLQPARPEIEVDGREQPGLSDGLLAMRVAEDVDGLASCELTLGNWGTVGEETSFLHFDRQTLEFGRPIVVGIAGDEVFRGRIMGLEAGFPEGSSPTLAVLAEDRFQDLRMTRRTRTFADLSDADVCREIASGHGLTPDVQLPGPTHKVVAQVNQSDLAFLRDRCRAVGAELWVADRTLNVRPRADRGTAPIKLAYGAALREFQVLADLAGQRTAVAVCGWDPAGKAAVREEGTASLVTAELEQGDSGSNVLSAALGDRTETIARAVTLTSAEAQARVEAAFRARARRFLCGRGVADPDGRLRVGTTVELEGLGDLFSGRFYVTRVVHRFDGERGLRTEFAVERPGLGRAT